MLTFSAVPHTTCQVPSSVWVLAQTHSFNPSVGSAHSKLYFSGALQSCQTTVAEPALEQECQSRRL